VNVIKKEIAYGEHTLTIETGEIARQATAAVMVSLGDTVVLVTVVARKSADPSRDFFPLTVNYIEKTYAAGKVPGGFLKREGRPSEIEVLTSRLIDRPIRPLFPKGFKNDVQVVATVMSLDPQISPDIPALIGASAVLAISGMPFNGPLAAAKVGYRDGVFVLNPSRADLAESKLELVVAGTKTAVLMVESEAEELSEEIMLGAVLFGHEMMQSVIQLIADLAREINTPAWDWQAAEANTELEGRLSEFALEKIAQAYQTPEKQQRQQQLETLKEQVIAEFVGEGEGQPTADEVTDIFSKLEKQTVRQRILRGEARIDGRDHKTVRPITTKTGLLPRTHGSALFTRGETQAIVVATLGAERDAQIIDALVGEHRDRFMLHYNFPPYCVGETGMMGSPKRREVGHGRLARRGLEAVLPSDEEFPYVIRVVSEITESNGSSSMASVCGSSLALMDAGVPLKAPVAGIAMGLVKEGEQFAVLTDILGDEDHLGDMDFKVAGTSAGITALQMDIKIDGITKQIMETALEQAKHGRLHILDIMNQTLSESRGEVSQHAPRIFTMQVPTDKIRDVIGKGGSTIRALTEETGVTIDISDEGIIKLFAVDEDAAKEAQARIELLTKEAKVGEVYDGTVSKIVDFGAFVTVLPGKDGLVHISQISNERIANVSDVLQEGQTIKVKVLEIDRQGKIRLTMRFDD